MGLLLRLRVELFYRFRLLVRRRICSVLAGELKRCHIEDGQTLLKGIRGGVESRIFGYTLEGWCGYINVRIRAADTDDLASSYRIAGVTDARFLRRIRNANPMKCW